MGDATSNILTQAQAVSRFVDDSFRLNILLNPFVTDFVTITSPIFIDGSLGDITEKLSKIILLLFEPLLLPNNPAKR